MSALAAYYQAMAREADQKGPLYAAQAALTTNQAEQVAPTAEASRGLTAAQTGLAGAEASTIAPKAQAEIEQMGAQSQNLRAQGSTILPSFDLTSQLQRAQIGTQLLQQTPLSSFDPRLGGLATRAVFPDGSGDALHFATGTADVPAKGAKPAAKKLAKTDTVPAMLAPGEAVLNRGAAEHLGRHVIHHMNKLGLLRMAAQDEIKNHAALVDMHKAPAKKAAAKAKKSAKQPAARKVVQHFAAGIDTVRPLIELMPGLDLGAAAK